MNKKEALKIIRNAQIKSRGQQFWERQIEAQEEYEEKFKKKIVAIFKRQEKGIVDRLQGKKRANVDIPAVSIDPATERAKFKDDFNGLVSDIIESEGNIAMDLVGVGSDIDMENPKVRNYLEKNTIKFSDNVNETTNDQIRRTLVSGLDEGEGIPKLTRRVRSVFTQARRYRSETVARTESARAMGFATEEAYTQSGVVEAKEWLTAFDERTCLYCASMSGKVVDINRNFFERGDKFLGLNLDYEAVGYPPLHPNCRCTLIPKMIEAPGVGREPVEEAEEVEWKPSMTREEADEWAKDSEITDDLYHGTPSLENAKSIKEEGFKLSGEGNFGAGVYTSRSRDVADFYAVQQQKGILTTKAKIRNYKHYDSGIEATEHARELFQKYESEYGKQAALEKGMDRILFEHLRENYDAVSVGRTKSNSMFAVFDPKRITTISKKGKKLLNGNRP